MLFPGFGGRDRYVTKFSDFKASLTLETDTGGLANRTILAISIKHSQESAFGFQNLISAVQLYTTNWSALGENVDLVVAPITHLMRFARPLQNCLESACWSATWAKKIL